MSMKIRTGASMGLARLLALSAFVASMSIALPAGAQTRQRCGRPGEPACPPPVCGSPGTAPCPGTLLDTYFNTNAGDNTVSLINPVSSETNICAMIYVFDAAEEMGECCGCPLSPQKLLSLSVKTNLTGDWAIFGGPPVGGNHQSGLIEIVSASPNVTNARICVPGSGCNGGCDPTNVPGYVTTRELKGYILHTQTEGIPEVPFADAGDPDATTSTYLEEQCGALILNGTGVGVCNCGP